MSLLLPELERQLRVAARRRRSVSARDKSRSSVRRPLQAAVGVLAVAAAIAAFLTFGLAGNGAPSAAQALERAAEAAQRGLAAPALAPGEYWYTRSIQDGTTGFSLYQRPALIQSRELVERWESSNGSGRQRSAADGVPLFFGTRAERTLFTRRESSAPKRVQSDEAIPSSVGFRSSLGALTYAQVLALPTDPSAMLARIRSAAKHSQEELARSAPGSPMAQQSLTVFELETVAGALTNLPLTPGSRAAVYRAMAHISGVRYLASVRDPLGRTGAALASQGSIAGFIDGTGSLGKRRRVTNELIFDPRTGALLAQQTLLDTAIPSIGLRAGYPIQYSAYVVSGNVASTSERFVAHGPSEVLAPAPPSSGCSSAVLAPAQVVSGPIPSAFLDQFAVLRRAATPEDQLPSSATPASFGLVLGISRILGNSVRFLGTAPNDARDYMLVGYRRNALLLPPRRCMPQLSTSQYDKDVAAQRAARKAPPEPVICVLGTTGNVGFPCVSASELDSIDYETSDYGRPPATVTGIIPDGVAAIRAIYPRGRHVFAHVEHGLLAYSVDLAAPNAAPREVLWLDSRGRLIRRVTAR
jgi:hypothetical protein